MTKFNIQLPQNLVRNKDFSSTALYVYAKLVQRFYVYKQEYSEMDIDHKQLMYYTGIKSNKKFKEVLNELYESKLIKNDITDLPRRGLIKVELDTFFNSKKKDYFFTQMPVEVLNKGILDEIGFQGVRLLLYFKSYINNWDEFCFCSYKRMTDELDMSENTLTKYIKLLKKKKFISVEKHELKSNGEYVEDEFGVDREQFTKYNNHYQIRYETIQKYKT